MDVKMYTHESLCANIQEDHSYVSTRAILREAHRSSRCHDEQALFSL
uniref:Uncharacterized protein n=1 Tax=Ascaris lumbricoides TaxID=6252 RepID=A0A0M3HGZ4_ASCLU